jgi:hypothetical protein
MRFSSAALGLFFIAAFGSCAVAQSTTGSSASSGAASGSGMSASPTGSPMTGASGTPSMTGTTGSTAGSSTPGTSHCANADPLDTTAQELGCPQN